MIIYNNVVITIYKQINFINLINNSIFQKVIKIYNKFNKD